MHPSRRAHATACALLRVRSSRHSLRYLAHFLGIMTRCGSLRSAPGHSAVSALAREIKEHAMAFKLQRRDFLQMVIGTAAASVSARIARSAAAGNDAVTIGWPNDIPSWDPNQRFTPDAQPIFKAVFDQPIDQDPQLKLIPHLIKTWNLAPDGLSMAVELRDDVTFHNGDKMTTQDFP